MKIGTFKLSNNLVLAPMAGVTDRPFRQLCKQLGAGMAVSEMVSSNSLLWGSKKTQRRANHEGEVEPRIVQIMGVDPEMMAEAARFNVNNGAQIIDINMGCPAKKVCRKAAGSALLADEGLVEDICQQVVDAVDVPVTLKIRTGTDHANRNALKIATIAERAGISALTIHGRTRADKFQGNAEYQTIRAVRESVDMTLIANGDIDSPEKAMQVLQLTRADGLMIGRAAQGRPWIFREINQFLTTGEKHNPILLTEIADIMSGHIAQLHNFYGEQQGVKIARKHVGWYLNSYPSAQIFKKHFNQINGPKEQLVAIASWFEKLQLKGVS